MSVNKPATILDKYPVDIPLLLMLSVFCIDKVLLKPVVLIFLFIAIRKDIKIRDFLNVPRFYIFMPLLALTQFFIFNNDFGVPHWYSFIIGILYWGMCLCAFVIVNNRLTIATQGQLKNTINLFFFINTIFSCLQLLAVMIKAGTINPYSSALELYGNSTGDYVKGIFLAPCYINMFVNSFFAIYYLHQKKYGFAFLACVIAYLTTSNFGNLLFLITLILFFFVTKDKWVKLFIGAQFLLIAIFYIFISAGNLQYMMSSLGIKKMNIINSTSVSVPAPAAPVSAAATISATDAPVNTWRIDSSSLLKPNGKVVSFRETYKFVLSTPVHFLFGAGIGNFSSFLALRTSDIEVNQESRVFQLLPRYIAADFYNNHYQIFSEVYKLPVAYHSAKHLPSSFLNQVFGEYGIIGFLLFLFTYCLYFLKRYKKLSYSLIIGIAVLGYMLFDYLFEYLSVMIFFETFLLLDIRQHKKQGLVNNEFVS